MSRRAKNTQQARKSTKSAGRVSQRRSDAVGKDGLPADYWNACEFVQDGRYDKARKTYARLQRSAAKADSRLCLLIQNDLAVLAAMEGKFDEACQGWRGAIESNGECLPARLNLGLVEAELSLSRATVSPSELKTVPAPEADEPVALHAARLVCPPSSVASPQSPFRPVRIALLSFLFNWPSTGGGNMHTAGLVEFLSRAGYDVRHFYARYPAWGIGRVEGGGLAASEGIEFSEREWNVATIRERFRSAVDSFGPDFVVISDTWNMKPHLAEAMRGYPCLLMVQAQECLCPLNNLRLLGIGPNQVEQCPRN